MSVYTFFIDGANLVRNDNVCVWNRLKQTENCGLKFLLFLVDTEEFISLHIKKKFDRKVKKQLDYDMNDNFIFFAWTDHFQPQTFRCCRDNDANWRNWHSKFSISVWANHAFGMQIFTISMTFNNFLVYSFIMALL